MTPRARILATVVFVASVAFACGKKEERPPVTTPPASPTPGVSTEASVATTTTTAPVGTAAPAVATAARSPAMTAPKVPATTQATPPQAPPPTAAAPSVPPPTPAARPAATPPAAPARPAAQRPKGKITLPAKLGAVTFDHEGHAGTQRIACTTCHHPSRPSKPLASEQQACRDCHTTPAAPPMKTSLQAAFHDPMAAKGTCIDCHRQKGGKAPVKCTDCHKKK